MDEDLISETERMFEVTIKDPLINHRYRTSKIKKNSRNELDILIDFLMSKGFIGEMKMTSSYIELSREDKFIDIPNEEFIPPTILKDVLQNAD